MSALVALLGLAITQGPLAVWRDPERALRVPLSSLPRDLRDALELESEDSRHRRLIKILAERSEDWKVHATIRAEIARGGSPAFAKEALATVAKSRLQYEPRTTRHRLRAIYNSALAMSCAKLADRGGIKVDKTTRDLWFNEGQDFDLEHWEVLRSVEDAYAVLSCLRNVTLNTKVGRDCLAVFERRFGDDVGLSLYAVRLYAVGVSGAVNVPLRPPFGNGKPARRASEFDAPYRPDIVREAALSAWRENSSDPGVLAVVGAGLANLRDTLASKAATAYGRADDPDPFRATQLHGWYPSYFPMPKA